MAKTKAKNPMAGKILKGVKEHKHDTTTMSAGGDLPAGVEGIAQLTDCEIGFYDKEGYVHNGKPFFRASAIVKEPVMFGKVKVAGRRTQIGPEPICDTPEKKGKKKTQEDHVEWILNELRKIDEAGVHELPDECTVEELDAFCRSLAAAGPHIAFRTWQGRVSPQYPNPQTNHEWNGIVDYEGDDSDEIDDQGEVEDEVEDEVEGDDAEPEASEEEVETEDESEGDAEEETEDEVDDTESEEEGDDDEEPAAEEEEEQEPDADYLQGLVAKLEEQDAEALDELAGLADKFSGQCAVALNAYAVKVTGKKKKEVDAIPLWSTVVSLIQDAWEAAAAEDETEEEEEEGPYEPEEGDIVTYKPAGAKKPNKYEVSKVFKKNQTVKLKNVETGKVLAKPIEWAKVTKVD